ncbi:hypothetical protein [Aliarcobacter butzleri]|uniref:hypothetical protein n=1 Tax=Aliarcobacter butzleri TaxID=28197 RepID=UPI0012699BDB|nr:hypothetical protein [Aliarcobacter butzleri]
MKKVIMGLCFAGALFANAEISKVEEGVLLGAGFSASQKIILSNSNFDINAATELCSNELKLNDMIKDKSQESLDIALTHCVSQLKNTKANNQK